ncbi:MAG: nucleotidyltransferase domain-containing protein [Verrucomicrobiota bacterium]|nr:nucleotidyltransferase domain-containing protein [Verrucomicrobiota bacterium]
MKRNINAIKKELIKNLQPISPLKVILFGSYAYGSPKEESDIDLYVVTKDDFIPKDYQEKRQLVRRVSKQIESLREKIAIDLLVHTKAMNEKFYKMKSSFANEIESKGEIIYE